MERRKENSCRRQKTKENLDNKLPKNICSSLSTSPSLSSSSPSPSPSSMNLLLIETKTIPTITLRPTHTASTSSTSSSSSSSSLLFFLSSYIFSFFFPSSSSTSPSNIFPSSIWSLWSFLLQGSSSTTTTSNTSETTTTTAATKITSKPSAPLTKRLTSRRLSHAPTSGVVTFGILSTSIFIFVLQSNVSLVNALSNCFSNQYFDVNLQRCVDCRDSYGSKCIRCNADICSFCVNGSYFNISEDRCKDCVPTPFCDPLQQVCTDDNATLCEFGGCETGAYNVDPTQPQSLCAQCNDAPNCKPGGSVCVTNLTSECGSGNCVLYYFNNPKEQSLNSTCRLLPLVLSTFYKQYELSINEVVEFEDSLATLIGQNRGQYPYNFYFQDIFKNPNRDNCLDFGINFPNAAQGFTLQLLFLSMASQNNQDLLNLNVECVLRPTDQLRPLNGGQRSICLGCEPIDNCLVNVTCNGLPPVSRCTLCEPGFYRRQSWNQWPDECAVCPIAAGCANSSVTVCTNETDSLCTNGNCADGYYQLQVLSIGLVQRFRCIACEPNPGCKDGFTRCTPPISTGFPTNLPAQSTTTCAKGKCRQKDGWYSIPNPECNDDPTACFLANIVIQMNVTEDKLTEELIGLVEDTIAQYVFGIPKSVYPLYNFRALGTRTNSTSGLGLIDFFFATVSTGFSPINENRFRVIEAVLVGTEELLAVGITCATDNNYECSTGVQYSPYRNQPVCSPCFVPNDLCEEVLTCPKGPYASRCEKCQDGFYNHPGTGYEPDVCTACPLARNCTLALGSTVCDCPATPLCLAGECVDGYWNNPPLPELDCQFNDAYACWTDDEIVEAAALDPTNDFMYIDWYGLDFLEPFQNCPHFGQCRVRKNIQDPLRCGYNYYWNDELYYSSYYNDTVDHLDTSQFKLCSLTPPPKRASVCKRWSPGCGSNQYEEQGPTNIRDRICLNCLDVEYCQSLEITCTNATNSVCSVGGCVYGYSNNATNTTCIETAANIVAQANASIDNLTRQVIAP